MAKNKIEEVIEALMRKSELSEDETELLEKIKKQADVLGDNATEAEMTAMLEKVISEHFVQESGGDSLNEADQTRITNSASQVRNFLNDEDWHFTERAPRADDIVFEMGVNANNVRLRIRIDVEVNPDICVIRAYLPIVADPKYVYPLCETIAARNYIKKFGSLNYDKSDGELVYKYAFPTEKGIERSVLGGMLSYVAHNASDDFIAIRKKCIGRFNAKEINDIFQTVNELVRDLRDDQ